MKDFEKQVLEYQKDNNLDGAALAEKLGISLDELKEIEEGKSSLNDARKDKILDIITKKASKRSIKALDLIFRLGAVIMSLVVLLLSINDNIEPNTLIILLSIGVFCSAINSLPKIDK